LISDKDLEVLESFRRDGQIMLTAYLGFDNLERRESAYQDFIKLAEKRLEECGHRAECREAIREDMEIVGLYLKTNGRRHHAGLAIFSCASELFWRAYPLPRPVETDVLVGPRFEVEPLREIASQFVSA
jgi:hypothetical protein